MNRAERRKAAKQQGKTEQPTKKKTLPPLAQAPSRETQALMTLEALLQKMGVKDLAPIEEALDKWRADIMLETVEHTVSLVGAVVAIILHDRYDFTTKQLLDVMGRIGNHIACAHQGYVNYDELLTLVASFGLPITGLKLDNIQEESRTVQAKLIEYEKLKESVENTMTIKDKIHQCLEAGETDVGVIAEKVGTNKRVVSQIKYLYKKQKGTVTPQDLAEVFFDEEEQDLLHQAQALQVKDEPIIPNQPTESEKKTMSNKKSRLQTLQITLQGAYAKYEISENKVNVNVFEKMPESLNNLSKEKLSEFIGELQEVEERLAE